MDTIRVTRADQGQHWPVVTSVTTIEASGQGTSGNLPVVDVAVAPGEMPKEKIR